MVKRKGMSIRIDIRKYEKILSSSRRKEEYPEYEVHDDILYKRDSHHQLLRCLFFIRDCRGEQPSPMASLTFKIC